MPGEKRTRRVAGQGPLIESEETMGQCRMSGLARTIASVCVGGLLLQSSCSLVVQDVLVRGSADVVGGYIWLILERFMAGT
ncbi:MAG: hypothetical protein JW955_25015 [Sedimentisphaerales bacterium]|nr:hypothetical protein [Sedimentisphaerales bacterium]